MKPEKFRKAIPGSFMNTEPLFNTIRNGLKQQQRSGPCEFWFCSIANPAVGVRPFSFADMQASVQRISAQAVPIVLKVIARIPQDKDAMGPELISTGEPFKGSYTNPDADRHNIVDPADK